MVQRANPLKRQWFPQKIILMVVGWYCRYQRSCRGVRDMLAVRRMALDASAIYRRCHWALNWALLRSRCKPVPFYGDYILDKTKACVT